MNLDHLLENKIKYLISGTNLVTEATLPSKWIHWKTDWLNIKGIHKKFGRKKIITYPHLGYFQRWYYVKFRQIKTIPLLNYVPYNKDEAKKLITNELK